MTDTYNPYQEGFATGYRVAMAEVKEKLVQFENLLIRYEILLERKAEIDDQIEIFKSVLKVLENGNNND